MTSSSKIYDLVDFEKISPTLGRSYRDFCDKENIDPDSIGVMILPPFKESDGTSNIPTLGFTDREEPWSENSKRFGLGMLETYPGGEYEALLAAVS